MKNETNKQSLPLSARMVGDESMEKLKKRLRDMGLIVNAGDGAAVKPINKKKDGKK